MGGHHHGHDHHHGHGHAHAPADFGRAFAIGTLLNIAFVVVEGGAGFWFDSVALLADAGHNLSDVLGLLIAWGGVELAKRPATRRFTYGLGASTILAALANALVLLMAVGAILLETIQRLGDPRPIDGWPVVWVALAGIGVNLATALLFARGRHGDVNIRGAYLHMAADAAVSAGVVVAGLVILWTGATWIDPLVSLIVVAIIVVGTWGLLSESLLLALQAVPRGIDAQAVEAMLAAQDGVVWVHDLHIWPMSTTETALTAHLVMPAGHPGDAFLADLGHRLEHDFGIGHATVQVETGDTCALTHAH
ncbi:cation diffusion facilitator family transporter [Sphingomonas sp. 2R-10]|uniref:cation diffusion facilitator family transporter n=1 Tax=Sphingomonas sp. 2R-10 TaxID=3045148 RepID=UPI000F79F017|nr:cation diffusion facilitator family transporter [Sphingomonas sp. 2R-10]MDJ0278768.1 cation diffusion facilitator family transporter [Sphingomonas sp. 2R-10]